MGWGNVPDQLALWACLAYQATRLERPSEKSIDRMVIRSTARISTCCAHGIQPFMRPRPLLPEAASQDLWFVIWFGSDKPHLPYLIVGCCKKRIDSFKEALVHSVHTCQEFYNTSGAPLALEEFNKPSNLWGNLMIRANAEPFGILIVPEGWASLKGDGPISHSRVLMNTRPDVEDYQLQGLNQLRRRRPAMERGRHSIIMNASIDNPYLPQPHICPI